MTDKELRATRPRGRRSWAGAYIGFGSARPSPGRWRKSVASPKRKNRPRSQPLPTPRPRRAG
jgi:hypothetical protein